MMKTETEQAFPIQLIDPFGRRVDYMRISVTDRCDFRCQYCMAEDMTFLPRAQILSYEEITFIARAFSELGVEKIRLTGGEPLIRHDSQQLIESLGALPKLKELTLSSNGSQLGKMAPALKAAGVQRINISLDSLDAKKFKRITRTGNLSKVLAGIDAAVATGFKKLKINAVIMRGHNEEEVLDLVAFAIERGIDVSFIEEMPLGNVNHDRALSYCSSDDVREILEQRYSLFPTTETTNGPSRYYRLTGIDDTKVGFISPHSHNFCASCNRVRLTAEGRLLLCLGNEHSADLRAVVRRYPGDMDRLKQEIIDAISRKPERHYFDLNDEPQIVRFMNMTGG
ncbi:GTP 3',8-cyclase MoaA [Porticoccus sp. W117]|uniref:GTP 3',8-cyclase MoaA n=1 Tax=Porticoccus sp. W117 TaxID=3054777 RepID=UPI00259AA7DB|nr:GTP 3',8-cyclase MoaA [Porticoccus sp. W117]MDM3871883.1 GTP 3',8-cyclase MoaA [Porticoccus sp. W117]